MIKKIREQINTHRVVFENLSYITLLQLILVLAPLVTFPYLVNTIGKELYGWVITSEVLAGYGTIVVNFGTDRICSKYVSIHRDNVNKLSEIVSSVLVARTFLFMASFAIYIVIVMMIPSYSEHLLLFVFAFGINFNEWLFPQFFFQGIEKMKYTSLLNIGIKVVFITLIFLVIKKPSDYVFVPLLYAIGFLLGGLSSLYIIFYKMKIRFMKPSKRQMLFYLKESGWLFSTDVICTIKDKFNYFFLGAASMGNVVIYDLGSKITVLLTKPGTILATVFFPRFAKNRDPKQFVKVLMVLASFVLLLVIVVNIFMSQIAWLMLHEEIDLLPLRIFSLAPLFLTISSFVMSNLIIAFGYNKYALYSILVTVAGYLIILFTIYITHNLGSLYAFVLLAVTSYFIEMVYRLYVANRVIKKESLIKQ